MGFETKDRAFRSKSFQGRQVVSQAAHARRLIHGLCERPSAGAEASWCVEVVARGEIVVSRPAPRRSAAREPGLQQIRPATTSG